MTQSITMPVALAPSRPLTTTRPLRQATPSITSKPLYASQATLPHLPVPTLSSTFNKYLETIAPLQSTDQHSKSTELVKSFLSSELASTLQGRVEKRAGERDSWLSEWWNETAYMGYRGRIVPNVSYFYVHTRGCGKGEKQEERAAELVRATVEFKKLTDRSVLLFVVTLS